MHRFLLSLCALLLLTQPAYAQDRDRARERENRDRIERLERQVRQVQRRVYPDGPPADTAGFYDEPVATRQSVDIMTGRIEALERQVTTLVRQSEEAQFRLGQMEADVARLRATVEELRSAPPPPAPTPMVETPAAPDDALSGGADAGAVAAAPPPAAARPVAVIPITDPVRLADGEEAYNVGFRLWDAGDFDGAIRQLDAMIAQYPGHPKLSWARNLKGRALLDANRPREAAEVLLANYRGDETGERAADSLYFLGQALMRLNQPSQACRVYDELEDVYGGAMRSFLAERLPAARAAARCDG
ncbi:tetratricopeptide repeat protein [Sphingomicrobium astaxanthinifaciens]|uniref:tetratricopeptide repeat protein n=1 Tax=Sphingomicrobium astaxanthinifaciens TaxID=1227949 RepID=UPI001FCB370E|nr:tetratricopeptide repeat protein [Sphingomicrobium astaxanthinifaciens]MCJ7421533.1 tetratricopeptide repeat protein [Sphingomicrobium astaxanthinifaciens]